MSGAEQLKDWMTRRGFNQQETADYLGVDFTNVSKIVNGLRGVGLSIALVIERKTGIPVEAWEPSGLDTEPQTIPSTRKTRR